MDVLNVYNVTIKNKTPTVDNLVHLLHVLMKAAVPLIEDKAADATQTQEQSSVQSSIGGCRLSYENCASRLQKERFKVSLQFIKFTLCIYLLYFSRFEQCKALASL